MFLPTGSSTCLQARSLKLTRSLSCFFIMDTLALSVCDSYAMAKNILKKIYCLLHLHVVKKVAYMPYHIKGRKRCIAAKLALTGSCALEALQIISKERKAKFLTSSLREVFYMIEGTLLSSFMKSNMWQPWLTMTMKMQGESKPRLEVDMYQKACIETITMFILEIVLPCHEDQLQYEVLGRIYPKAMKKKTHK